MARKRKKLTAAEAIAPVLAAGRAVNVAELAEELIAAMDGPRAFARAFVAEMKACKPGTVAKARMLQHVATIVNQANQLSKDSGRREDQLDQSELVELATALLAKAGTGHAQEEKDA